MVSKQESEKTKNELEKAKQELESAKQSGSKKQNEIDELNKKIKDLEKIEQEFEKAKQESEKTKNELEKAKQELESAKQSGSKKQNEIDELSDAALSIMFRRLNEHGAGVGVDTSDSVGADAGAGLSFARGDAAGQESADEPADNGDSIQIILEPRMIEKNSVRVLDC